MPARTTRRLMLAIFAARLALGMAFGPAMDAAAQKSRKSSASGKTSKTKGGKRRARRQRGQKAPTPDRVREIQEALAKDGFYTAKPSGKWDAATVEAMKRFQGMHELNPTGKLDARSLQKLGLGSEIAGVAPPMPGAAPSMADQEGGRDPR